MIRPHRVPAFPALALGLALAACAPTPATVTPVVPTVDPAAGPTDDPNAEPLTIDLQNSELAVGEERISFKATDAGGGPVVGDAATTVETVIYQVLPDGRPVKAAEGAAVFFGGGLPDGGVWVVYTQFDASGPWAMDVIAKRPDGWTGRARAPLQVAGRTVTPRVGQPAPEGDTPTADGRPLAEVTSDPEPDPGLYALSVTEAAATRRPTIVVFASPAHCPTELCRAVLEEVKATKVTYGSRANFIHVETRDLADPSSLSATTKAWSLPSEPWTFVLTDRGLVAARIEGALDRLELGLLLDRDLAGGG